MGISWIKRGTEAHKAIDKEEKDSQARYEQNKRMWRFYLAEDEEATITFVDGDLNADGVLDLVTYRQHQLFMNNTWNNFFVCTQDVEPCPICESGDYSTIVGILTIIDHRVTKSKDGTKTYRDQPRLFVAKRDTIKQLQKIATKRKGLAGATFEVTRVGKKSAAVGTQFDFVDKHPIEELKKKFVFESTDAGGKKVMKTFFEPADYEKEIVYKSADELRELGFGSTPFGKGKSSDTEDEDLSEHM